MKEDRNRLRSVWGAMKGRCLDKNNNRFYVYGAKGVKICDEWLHNFDNFYNWSIENGYCKGLSIDRIDVKGNYEPNNCRWVTMKVQQNNRSNTIFITYKGETKSVMEWHEITGIKHKTLLQRYHKGLSAEEIIESPLDYNEKFLELNGKKQSISAWGRELNIDGATIQQRLYSGWSVEDALTEKVGSRKIFIEYDGENLSLQQWADKLDVPYKRLHGRHYKGWSNKEILYGRNKQ